MTAESLVIVRTINVKEIKMDADIIKNIMEHPTAQFHCLVWGNAFYNKDAQVFLDPQSVIIKISPTDNKKRFFIGDTEYVNVIHFKLEEVRHGR